MGRFFLAAFRSLTAFAWPPGLCCVRMRPSTTSPGVRSSLLTRSNFLKPHSAMEHPLPNWLKSIREVTLIFNLQFYYFSCTLRHYYLQRGPFLYTKTWSQQEIYTHHWVKVAWHLKDGYMHTHWVKGETVIMHIIIMHTHWVKGETVIMHIIIMHTHWVKGETVIMHIIIMHTHWVKGETVIMHIIIMHSLGKG